jgi:RNAse (barnase) inhibitor barstar
MPVDISLFSFDLDALALDGAADFSACLPAGIAGKPALLEAYRQALRLPDYFGENWDSFSDCLNDLSWIPQRRVAIIHADLPALTAQDRLIYIEILAQCAGAWKPGEAHELVVGFPPAWRSAIMEVSVPAKIGA